MSSPWALTPVIRRPVRRRLGASAHGFLGRRTRPARSPRIRAAPRACGQRFEGGMAAGLQLGVGHDDVAEHAGGGDLGLVEGFASRQLGRERGDGARALGPAAQDPLRPAQRRGPDQALISGGADLVDRAGGERNEAERAPPLGPRDRQQSALGPDGLVEPGSRESPPSRSAPPSSSTSEGMCPADWSRAFAVGETACRARIRIPRRAATPRTRRT